jgi:outer membrane lipoprotein-sorting protein
MNAQELLEMVARRYAELKSLAVEIVFVSEEGDEDSFGRAQTRTRAWFVAPGKVRVERGGRRREVTVTDGNTVQHFSAMANFHTKNPARGAELLPGLFRSEFLHVGENTFLFGRMAEHVRSAEILREEAIREDGGEPRCTVVAVTYEGNPGMARMNSSSPITFWVDGRTSLVRKVSGEFTMRVPASDETHTKRYSVTFERITVDGALAGEVFEFTPPPEALDNKGRRGYLGSRMGHAQAGFGTSKKNWVESSSSGGWEDDAYVENLTLRIWEMELKFERRLRLLKEEKKIEVVERVSGPKGEEEMKLEIPVG